MRIICEYYAILIKILCEIALNLVMTFYEILHLLLIAHILKHTCKSNEI